MNTHITSSITSCKTECHLSYLFVFFHLSIWNSDVLQIYVKNFTLAIQHEFAPYGISVQLITPLYVRTKMNNYSTTVMKGNIFCPDVETYTKSAVSSLGRTNETTGYWIHGLQVCLIANYD